MTAKNKRVRGNNTEKSKALVTQALITNIQGTVNDVLARRGFAYRLGKSYGGDRELYEALGYPYTLQYSRYQARYDRQGIARRVVNAYPDATWRGKPDIIENDEETETPFEREWKSFVKKHKVYHYLRRADRLAGIGNYSVLLMGFNDVASQQDMIRPVTGTNNTLLYLQPYSQHNATIHEYEMDSTNERYGKPKIYKLSLDFGDTGVNSSATSSHTIDVHYSRLLHIADDTLESDTMGTPRLQAVYNRMQDLETIVGGSAEMFWRGAFPGLSFEADKDVDMGSVDADGLEDEIQNYIHGVNRFLRLQGVKTNQLRPAVASPENHVKVQLQMVSACTGIPLRILTGSEMGELASSQDKENWNSRVDERRGDFAEPMILRPFIDSNIKAGALASPINNEYNIIWPDINAKTEKEKVEIAKIEIGIVKDYIQSGGDVLMSPVNFLVEFLNWDKEKAITVTEEVEQMITEEEKETNKAMEDFIKQTGSTPEQFQNPEEDK